MHPIDVHLQCAVSAHAFPQSHPTKPSFYCHPIKEKSSPRCCNIPKIYVEYEERGSNIYTLDYTEFQVFLSSEKIQVFF